MRCESSFVVCLCSYILYFILNDDYTIVKLKLKIILITVSVTAVNQNGSRLDW